MSCFKSVLTNFSSENGSLRNLYGLCKLKENKAEVLENSMELFKVLMNHYLTNETSLEDIEYIQKCFDFLVEIESPKVMVYSIMDFIIPQYDLEAFYLVFPYLKTVCLKLLIIDEKYDDFILEKAFSQIIYYSGSLNMPNYSSVCNNPGSKPDYKYQESIIFKFIQNCTDFVDEILDVSSNLCKKVKKIVFIFCADLMRILCEIDFDGELKRKASSKSITTPYKKEKVQPKVGNLKAVNSSGYRVVKRLVRMFSRLEANWSLLHKNSWKKFLDEGLCNEEDLISRRHFASGCFFYFIINCNINIEYFPQIIQHKFRLYSVLPSIYTMLNSDVAAIQYKGIQLSLFTFSNIENLELVNSQVCELLSKDFGDEFDVICKLLMRLSCLALLGDKYFKCITSQVIRMIPIIINKFQWSDRYNFIYMFLKDCENSSVVDFIISYYKDKIHEILSVNCLNEEHKRFISTSNTDKIFEKIFELPENYEFLLLQYHHRFMAALNLVYYLLRRDTNNLTGILNKINQIEKSFISPIILSLQTTQKLVDESHNKEAAGERANIKSREELERYDHMNMMVENNSIFDLLFETCISVNQLIEKVDK